MPVPLPIDRQTELTNLLLSISQAIARIRNRADLLRVIYEDIHAFFPFDDAGIAILNEAGNQYFELLTDQSIHRAGKQQYAEPGYFERWLPVDESITEVIRAQQPLLIDMAAETVLHPAALSRLVFRQVGSLSLLGRNLQIGARVIGALTFSSQKQKAYAEKDFPFFNAIADQVAVATANILANEEILQREQEMMTLLSISQAIATIRDKQTLLEVILAKIKPLFTFYDCGLFVFDSKKEYLEDLTVSFPSISPSEASQMLVDANAAIFPFPGSVFEPFFARLRSTSDPVIHNYKTDIIPGWADYVQAPILDQLGYAESMFCLLKTGGEEIGAFAVNSLEEGHFRPSHFKLFQNITDQLSVAVANILANEEILKREQEKALHLVVTSALTSVQPWNDKFLALVTEIGKLVPWDHCSIVLPDRPTLSMRWRRNDDDSLDFMSFEQTCRELGVSPVEFMALIAEVRVSHDQPAIYSGADLAALRHRSRLIDLTFDHWHIRSQLDLPIPINGLSPIVLTLTSRQPHQYTNAQLALLQRLTLPMALALENTFFVEQLAQREAEKTRQLALNQVLVGIKTSERLYAAIADELNKVALFDAMSVRVIGEQKLLRYVIMGKVDGRFIDVTEQARLELPTIDELEMQEAVTHPEQATIYTGDEFDLRCDNQSLYQLRRDHFGIRSSLEVPLPMKEAQLAILMLHSRVPYAFTEHDLTVLLQLIPPVGLALENLLAFEEIKALKKRLEQEKTYLVEEIKTTHNFEEIIGTSSLLNQVFRQVSQVAPTDTTVLITGESGTGKELIARAVHNRSPRKGQVLIKLNCAALPASLIESELFGHEKGAFTGAIDKRIGKFELANGGTLFLDEIGEIPLELQSKLLRVLQEKEYERLGSNKVHKTDVRIIAATNRDLEKEVAEGRFRLDLFYRLSVFPLHLPPLRERREDIPLLAIYFAQKFCRQMGKPFRGIADNALSELMNYPWPGNIRELENIIEQAVIINEGHSSLILGRSLSRSGVGPSPGVVADQALGTIGDGQTIAAIKQEKLALERGRLLAVLQQTGGRIRGEGGAAQLLGVKPTTLEARLSRLGIKREHSMPVPSKKAG